MMIRTRSLTVIASALLLPLLSVTISGCSGTPAQAAPCNPTYVYSHVKDQGSALYVIDIETDHNGTTGNETYELNDTRTGSFSIEDSVASVTQVSASLNAYGQVVGVGPGFTAMGSAQASAAYSYVHATDNSVKTTTSLSVGSTVSLTVPPGATGYGLFGVVVKVTNGDVKSTNCPSLQQDSHETVILPEEVEWCTWVRGPDEFADGGLSPCVVVGYDLAH